MPLIQLTTKKKAVATVVVATMRKKAREDFPRHIYTWMLYKELLLMKTAKLLQLTY